MVAIMKQSINEEINFIWILFCISGWDISSDLCNGVNLFLFNIFNVPLLKTENHLAFSENIPDWMSLALLFPDNFVNISRYLAIPTFSNNAPLFVRAILILPVRAVTHLHAVGIGRNRIVPVDIRFLSVCRGIAQLILQVAVVQSRYEVRWLVHDARHGNDRGADLKVTHGLHGSDAVVLQVLLHVGVDFRVCHAR